MQTLVVMSFVAFELAFCFLAIVGWGHRKSRELIAHAIVETRRKNFKIARALVIQATRFNGNLRKYAEIQALYDIILSETVAGQAELERLESRTKTRKASWPEVVWNHPLSRIIFFGILILGALLRFISLTHT